MTEKPAQQPVYPRSLRRMVAGPALALVLAIALFLLERFFPITPNPLPVMALAIILSAAYGGILSGLGAAAVAWLTIYYGYQTGTILPITANATLTTVITAAAALPVMALIVGLLKYRLEQTAQAAVQREQEQTLLVEQTLAEREREREELAQERSLWQSVLANVQDMIYVKDLEGRYVLASQALLDSLDMQSEDDVIGKTDFDIHGADLAAKFHAEDEEVVQTGQPVVNREVPTRDAAGRALWSLTTKVPWRDLQGDIIGVMGVSRDITERRQALDALRAAEARYRALVERLPAIVYEYELDGSGRTTYISPQVEDLLGVPPAEWLADPQLWPGLIHPDDREWAAAEVRRAADSREPLDIQYRMVARDGRVLWLRNQAFPLPAANGASQYAQGVMLDITAFKQAEQARRASEERYELVTWATNDAVWEWNLATNTVWWSEGLQRLFRHAVTTEDQDFSWWLEHIHPGDQRRVRESLQRAIAGDDPFWSKEYRFQRADGTYAEVFDRGYIMQDDAGQPVRVIGALTDISQRKRIEEALRDAEGKYRALVEQLPAVVYLAEWGAGGRWHYVSPQIQSLLGFTPQEWMADATLWERQIHPDDLQRIQADEAQDAERQPGWHGAIEYRLIARDGRAVWVRDSAVIVSGEPGQPRLYQGVLADITEEKRAQNALQEANDILTQWLQHSERRTMELGLLNELSSLMQNCRSIDEASRSAASVLRRLFGDEQLGLYLRLPNNDSVARVVWADRAVGKASFEADACWAIRRGQIHAVDADRPGPLCRHVADSAPEAYMCVPILVAGEPRAVLHVRKAPPAGRGGEKPLIGEGQLQLARTVADSMGLAFANLELRDSLREQSIRDPLTGLFNRRYMEESLEREIHRAARHARSVSVVMLDIDHFKGFNDAYGHPAGDVLLRELGRMLRRHIRGADIACRYGGEEFILILPEAALNVTGQRAEHLRQEMAHLQPEFAGQILDPVTLSMGVAGYPAHGISAEGVLRAADEALYQAKREGRNRVAVYSGSLQT